MDTSAVPCIDEGPSGSDPNGGISVFPRSPYAGQPKAPLYALSTSIEYSDRKQLQPLRDHIIVIYDRLFLAECMKIVLQGALDASVEISPSIDGDFSKSPGIRSRLVLISVDDLKKPNIPELIDRAKAAVPNARIVVMAYSPEPRQVREVLECGAKGCIPMTMGFAVAIEAVKFILAGGTYAPPESLMASESGVLRSEQRDPARSVSPREMEIIRAIQQGKSNKIIAYELNLCESTVKVHIRNIMKKLHAKNRTDVAVRSARLIADARAG